MPTPAHDDMHGAGGNGHGDRPDRGADSPPVTDFDGGRPLVRVSRRALPKVNRHGTERTRA